MTTINPYLTFNGDCEAAFTFYQSVFGGEFHYIGKFKDMPAHPDYTVSESELEKIMHVSLPISKETVLMGCDSSKIFGKATVIGNNYAISINTHSVEEVTRLFNTLSAGGKVIMPLNMTFWGAFFGQLTDKFGIHWMVSHEFEKHKDH